jgi:hypothetical protein
MDFANSIQDLPHALFRDAKDFSQGRDRLTLLMSRANVGIAVAFRRRSIRDWRCG